MSNDELIATGHELAKCLDNEPLIDIAKMIVRLADKLDVTTAALREKTKQCEAMAAENAALKSALEWLYEAVSMPDSGHVPDKYYSAVTNAAAVMYETPATAAFLREVRAQGVEAFAASLKVVGGKEHPYSVVAREFAAQLRQGGAA
ncbi:hypothetical protein [Cronobacter sakazakii]|uniref:hypothetical protein n=1 Tax=Cronobacter sakazakii TaxID=28141 RepID=UPI000CF0B065|nr:hypothetical protein [Cronobacter sakazakii]PPX97186.1 hypothetical protein C3D72_00585 [Cronobacter sakazakii]